MICVRSRFEMRKWKMGGLSYDWKKSERKFKSKWGWKIHDFRDVDVDEHGLRTLYCCILFHYFCALCFISSLRYVRLRIMALFFIPLWHGMMNEKSILIHWYKFDEWVWVRGYYKFGFCDTYDWVEGRRKMSLERMKCEDGYSKCDWCRMIMRCHRWIFA